MPNFLGNKRPKNYREFIENLGICIIKIHSVICHLDLFPENSGAMSDEQGQSFHQTLKNIENAYKGENMEHELGKYCSEQIRHEKKDHKRKAPIKKKSTFLAITYYITFICIVRLGFYTKDGRD